MNNPDIQGRIGYKFNDESLLIKALTHSSYIKEKKGRSGKDNERLEFLGDAFFDAIVSEELYRKLENVEEGKLTKLRALVVCEKSLARHGRQIDIGSHIFLGKGEETTGGRQKDAIIADALEAVIGAVFLDGGYLAAREMVLRVFKCGIDEALSGRPGGDYKTELQEKLQALGETQINYSVEREEGPDHNKTFYINLSCAGKLMGSGKGRSKKEAEQNAAKEALERGVEFVL